MIERDLSRFQNAFTEYTELRQQVNQSRLITMVNGHFVRNDRIAKQGVSARVYMKGSWGFASAPGLSDRDLLGSGSTALLLKQSAEQIEPRRLRGKIRADAQGNRPGRDEPGTMGYGPDRRPLRHGLDGPRLDAH